VITLEGLLTVIIIGPHALAPARWLPKVWGGRSSRFRNGTEFAQVVDLVIRFHNELVGWLEDEPWNFEPTDFLRGEGRDAVVIVDEWCEGFIRGAYSDHAGPAFRRKRGHRSGRCRAAVEAVCGLSLSQARRSMPLGA
jgi:yecA family protein